MVKNYSKIGAMISNQLALLDRNQSWLAMKCGVTSGQISHIISGRSNPSFKLLKSISEFISIDFSTLVQELL